jgi:cytidylate kinase
MNYKIAIDGPSGTGKSTTAKRLAKRLSFIYIDTGAMYRAVGLYCKKNNIDIENEKEVVKHLDEIEIDIFYKDDVQEIKLNGEIVSSAIRENDISRYASIVSSYKDVREKLVDMQRKLAESNSVIMDGRDIGTVVLPDADLKIYLIASSKVRAERRYKELIAKGQDVKLEDIEKELNERDTRDSSRKNSPLKKADDAIEVDSSDMNEQEVEDKLYDLFTKKVGM